MNDIATAPRVDDEPRQWPAAEISMRKVKELTAHPRNARRHSDEQIGQLVASIKRWGWTIPILVDEDGIIIAGHARTQAATQLGIDEVPVMVAIGWSDAEKRAYLLADNKLALNATWDDEVLASELAELRDQGFDLGLTGFNLEELQSLESTEDAESSITPSDGSLLALVDITIKEPRHVVEKNDVWKLGSHSLFCCSVITGWPAWAQHLQGANVAFCPYPGPFVALGDKASEFTLIMVQPDPYIAGHILDRYTEVHGTGEVACVHKGGEVTSS